MRVTSWTSLLLVAAVACSSRSPAPAVPTPTPEPTMSPLPQPVQVKVREVLAVLKRDLALEPAQEARIKAHLENSVGRVHSLTIIPLPSERGRAQIIRLTVDQFENELRGLLTDEQLARWEEIRSSVRSSISRVAVVPATTRTPSAP